MRVIEITRILIGLIVMNARVITSNHDKILLCFCLVDNNIIDCYHLKSTKLRHVTILRILRILRSVKFFSILVK